MAATGGPLAPYSGFPEASAAGDLFFSLHTGAGSHSKYEMGWGVEASLGANANLHLRFKVPNDLPTGQAKLVCVALANAATGAAKFDIEWAGLDAEEDASSNDIATNGSEGTQTITWATSDEDVYKELVVDLDANSTDGIAAGDYLVLRIVFETTSWTLAQVSTWNFWVIWE